MIISNNGDGFSSSDFAEQEFESLNRRLEPSNPTEFIKWVAQTVRQQRTKLKALRAKHTALNAKADRASVNLKRLDLITPFGEKFNLDRMKDVHRELLHKTQNIAFTLDRCKSVIDETTANYQFVGESLKKGLTDRHKKIAVQKELGLRLRDLDSSLATCEAAVNEQNTNADNLLRSVRKLLTRLQAELPPSEREQLNKDVMVRQIARRYGKKLQAEKPKKTGKVKVARNLGQFASEELVKPDFASTTAGKLLMVGAGIALGHLLLTKVMR